jgi:two-component system CheB/CheR fusion protein
VSASAFASLEHLFQNIPAELDAAYLVAVRQQGGLRVEQVVESLQRIGRLPVTVVADEAPLEAGRIYVGEADTVVTVDKGAVCARPADQPVGRRASIDTLLLSLSETYQERAVAVVLEGLGSDGTAGVASTKSCGGLAIAEVRLGEEAAEEAVTATGISDLKIPVEQIPAQIVAYVSNLRRAREAGLLDTLSDEQAAADQLARVANILKNVTGNDFHGYKHNTFMRRVARRMQVAGTERIETYIELLRSDSVEVQHLFQDLLIGVTQFFRDPSEYEVLEREAVPAIFAGRGRDQKVRVWVVGCATGEEAYSLAILLREHMATLDVAPQVQIFATDLDARALAVARSGRYAESIVSHVSPERLERWFVREGDTYRVAKELREMCIFSPHNVLKDAPFSRVDLLSCRNLLIYLNQDLQTRVIPIFHFALNPGGYLFLGNAENVTRHAKLFTAVDKKNRVYRRVESPTRMLPQFPITPRAMTEREEGAAPRRRSMASMIGRRAEQVAERYAPAYVVVDEHGEVLHFSGRTGRFLEPAPGVASLNVLSLVHRDLRLDLRSALQRAAAKGERVETPPVGLSLEGVLIGVNMAVEPLNRPDEPVSLVVVFQEIGPMPEYLAASELSSEHVQRLESELGVTKDRLQATIEELESTNEELKSSNEEYQSINEELQSANEELETSKEELQSVNEELQTVNHELATRVSELGRANSDLKNLLESTQIATIFLDNDLRVRSFTPAAVEVFHLLDTDVGRPIGHIAPRLDYPDLQQDARGVIRTLRPVEREVTGEGDRRFLTRVLPYRSIENVIAGAVVTFLDVTATTRAEAALRESEARFRSLFDLSALGQAQMDPFSLELRAVNSKLAEMLGYAPDGLIGKSILSITHPDDREMNRVEWEKVVAGERPGLSLEKRLLRRDGEPLWVQVSVALLRDANGQPVSTAAMIQDITARRAAEERQRVLVAELQHRVRNTLAVIRQIARRTAETSDNVDDYAAHLDGRINAFARTQSVLTRAPGSGVPMHEIFEDELLAHAAKEDQATVDGPRISLQAKAAETIGLAAHELATNALKYGALSTPDGRVQVRWTIVPGEEEERLHFEWRETGAKVLSNGPRRQGFGLTLLERTVPYQLDAEARVEFVPGGLICTIDMPLNDKTVIKEISPLREEDAHAD